MKQKEKSARETRLGLPFGLALLGAVAAHGLFFTVIEVELADSSHNKPLRGKQIEQDLAASLEGRLFLSKLNAQGAAPSSLLDQEGLPQIDTSRLIENTLPPRLALRDFTLETPAELPSLLTPSLFDVPKLTDETAPLLPTPKMPSLRVKFCAMKLDLAPRERRASDKILASIQWPMALANSEAEARLAVDAEGLPKMVIWTQAFDDDAPKLEALRSKMESALNLLRFPASTEPLRWATARFQWEIQAMPENHD